MIRELPTKSDIPGRIIKYLKKNGKTWIRELSRKTKIPKSTIIYWTTGIRTWKKPGMLVEKGIVKYEIRGGNVELWLSESN